MYHGLIHNHLQIIQLYLYWQCQVPTFGRNTACELEYSDYHEVAAAFGAKGFLLDGSSADEDFGIRQTLESAMEYSQLNKPVLINALIGKTDFREGSLSVWFDGVSE